LWTKFLVSKQQKSKSFELTDDSGTTSLTRFIGENRYYNVVSGSNGSGSLDGGTRAYGFFFPDLDIIILMLFLLLFYLSIKNLFI
jgi:hypothetical protein